MAPVAIDLGQTTKLTAAVSGGSGGLSYAWNGLPAGCSASNLPTLSCTPSAAGSFWVTVAVTDSNGETVAVGPLSLVVAPALGIPTVSVSETSFELGGSVTFSVSVSGGTGPLSYSWSGLPTGCASINAATVTCVPTGTGTFTAQVTVTDALGTSQTSSSSVPVTVKAVPAQSFASGANSLEWTLLGLLVLAIVLGLVAILLALRRKGGPSAKGEGASGSRSGSTEISKEEGTSNSSSSEGKGSPAPPA